MFLEKALNKAKRTDEEKVGLNIKVPVGLKNEFEEVCKKHGVSMTSMMLSLIETIVDESHGIRDAKEIEFQRLLNDRISLLNEQIKHFEDNVDPEYFDNYKSMQSERSRLELLLN
ncbi:hypothetical protein [Sulfurovum sp.]|uniref:hypothetical protein n=1 Tax=Sulfurovum sp. TaxID=1969726 RepID=UPI0025E73243|nr:hypothetical protein [Sulfurovum sp.]